VLLPHHALGHSHHSERVVTMSAYPLIATEQQTSRHVRSGPMRDFPLFRIDTGAGGQRRRRTQNEKAANEAAFVAMFQTTARDRQTARLRLRHHASAPPKASTKPGQRCFGKTKVATNKTNHATKASQNPAALGKAGRIVRFSTTTPSSAKSIEAMTSQIFGACVVMMNLPRLRAPSY
jgi:hypothetical protein